MSSVLSELRVPLVSVDHPASCLHGGFDVSSVVASGKYTYDYPVREPDLGGPLEEILKRLGWHDVLVIYEEPERE